MTGAKHTGIVYCVCPMAESLMDAGTGQEMSCSGRRGSGCRYCLQDSVKTAAVAVDLGQYLDSCSIWRRTTATGSLVSIQCLDEPGLRLSMTGRW